MLYDLAHAWLGWPEPKQVFDPKGSGTRVYADFASRKIGGALKLAFPQVTVKVGVLAENPNSDSTEAPLAVVCEFPNGATEEVLSRAHSLAWNFSRTALLITLEPHRLIAWSCYQNPMQGKLRRVCSCESASAGWFDFADTQNQRDVRDLLHWVSLVTSRAQRERPRYFPAAGRADVLLLKNLRYVRHRLLDMELPKEFCHDLLARVIFTQFLFHRKDSDGRCFFSERMMGRFYEDGTLSNHYTDLASILRHKTDTYALFRWMDTRFNGDLFPGKGGVGSDDYEGAWRAERKAVRKDHLDLLAQLVGGNLDIAGQQLTLWPFYSFDTIPLEFISSIYEEFLTEDEKDEDKAYYTPSHLVDYVLDAVLPWNDPNWDLKILDPCCGSGIFLVKAFQRLIYRWRLAHDRDPLVTDLRPILANNLVGVDMNKEAVRVACFSLYLAMADAIEPRHYVTRENVNVFPHLRGTRLLPIDFFDEETAEISTESNAEQFDLIIGNPPWGDKSIVPVQLKNESDEAYKERAKQRPTKAQIWAKSHSWHVANKDIGPVFLGKASKLLKQTGQVAMINTASLLYARERTAANLRRHLFTSFTFKEITNLSALRHELFAQAVGPSCVVVFGKTVPRSESLFYYFTPKSARIFKPQKGIQTSQGFTVEPQDVNTLTHHQAAEDSMVWPVLAMGSQRDLRLVKQLSEMNTLQKLETRKKVATREGVVFGNRSKVPKEKELRGLPLLRQPKFPSGATLSLDADTLPKWKEPGISQKDTENFDAFKLPQLVIKQAFDTKASQFRAVIVRSKHPVWGIICSQSYLTVRDLEQGAPNIKAACFVYNSILATYYLYNTSSRLGHYRTETLAEELVSVPLPEADVVDFVTAKLLSPYDVDTQCRQLFSLTAAEWTLIEDFRSYTLPEVLRRTPGPGRGKTRQTNPNESSEPYLTDYAKIFTRVVKGTFGRDKSVGVTIYTESSGSKWLPVRMLTVHLGATGPGSVRSVRMEADSLLDTLSKFYEGQLKKDLCVDGRRLGFQRVGYFLHPSHQDGVSVINLTIVKPDEVRYWTQSTAMRDADQMASAILDAAAVAKGKAR